MTAIDFPKIDPKADKGRLIKIIAKHGALFDGDMGCIAGVKARLLLKRDAKPVYLKCRFVPLKEAVEKEYLTHKRGIFYVKSLSYSKNS